MENPKLPVQSRSDTRDRNRALDVRRDNDTFKVPSINLYDIDYAILWFLQNKIQPQVTRNGNVLNVPVKFANGEKWVQVQRDGYLRDSDRKILVPLIMIKRISMAEDDRFAKLDITRLDSDNAIMYIPVTQQNNLHDLPRANNRNSYEVYISPIPTHVRVNYELIIWAETTEHLNKIVELIVPHDRLPWGDVYQFVTKIQDYSFDITNNIGEDRAAKCTIPLLVDGILQNEFDLKESNVQKSFSIKRVVFKNEVEEDNLIVDYEPKIIRPSESRLSQRALEAKQKK